MLTSKAYGDTTGVYCIESHRDSVDSEWVIVAPWPPDLAHGHTINTLHSAVLGVIGDDHWALEVVRCIRAARVESPILVLRQSSGHEGAVALLNSGADSCQAHDCCPREIEATVRALARRARISEANADFVIDENGRSVYLEGRWFAFGPVAFSVVRYLIENRDRWVSQREIIEQAIGTHYRADSAVARVQIFQIRRLLGPSRNVIRHSGRRGCGYMFTLKAEICE